MKRTRILGQLGLVLSLVLTGCAADVEEDSDSEEQLESEASAAIAPSALPKMPNAQVQDAIGRPLTNYDEYGGAGTNAAFLGSAMVVLAASSFSGNTASDARLKAQLRYNITSNHDPSGAGGYALQHELHFAVAAAIAKQTPRIWSTFTAAEKTKIDLVLKGLLVGAAYGTSVNNFEIKQGIGRIRNLRGNEQWWSGNPNFKCAGPAVVLAARVYFGSNAAVMTILNQFDKPSFAAQLSANKLTNMYETFRTNGPAGGVGPRPTEAQVESSIKNWKWAVTGVGLENIEALYTSMVNLTFSKPVAAGVNNGAGVNDDGQMRGRLITGAAGLPNKGVIGMAHEFDSSDAEGKRSSASYVMWGTRVMLDATTVLAIGGLLNRSSQAIDAARNRMHVGMVDLKYKSDKGYYSYAHAGGSGSEDWTPALRSQQWAWGYTFGTWFDMLKPFLDG